jgi:hypothetical protein
MRWLRTGVLITSLAAAGVLVLTLADCASPTQIVVEVFSDACPTSTSDPLKTIHDTGIAVSTPADIDTRVPTAIKSGCETPNGVGTLTIYPSGAKDDEVAIKVVGGVTSSPDKCTAPDYVGCIAHRRIVRFIPNVSQHIIVHLDVACLNRTCGDGQTCDQGVCKDESDILSDGGTVADAETSEAGVVDAGTPIVDASDFDACTGCKGTCQSGTCAVDCSSALACTGELCASTLPCNINCSKTGSCLNISCTTTQKCTIDCGPELSSCAKVACNAQNCDVTCDGTKSCETAPGGGPQITLDAGDEGKLTCKMTLSCDTNVSCRAATKCDLSCQRGGGPPNGQSCPNADASTCFSPDCTDWVNPQ